MNEDIVKLAKQEIAALQSNISTRTHVKTGDIRVVILIAAILKNDYADIYPFEIADRLLNDENDLVCKGDGWMLKVLSKVNEELVIEYLKERCSIMPRVSFRYAVEKMDTEKRRYLMGL